MKKLIIILLSALSLAVVAQDKKTVAVLNPICRDNSVNLFFQQMVRGAMESAVTASSEYEAYDRSAFDQIQKEQAFQRTGAVNDSQIKKIGELAGVDYVLVSEVSAYEGYLSAIIKILNVTTGKYDKSTDDFMELKPEAVKSKCKEMAASLFGKIHSPKLTSNTPSMSSTKPYDSNKASVKTTELYKVNPLWKKDPQITEDCITDIALVHQSVKDKKYWIVESAWEAVYENCPNANKSIYVDGARILLWRYENSASKDEKRKYADKLIELYDKRIFYFGDDSKYPTAYILGEKGIAYIDCFGNEKLEQAHDCLLYSIQQLGKKSKLLVLVKLVDCSYALYKTNRNAKQFIADYELTSKYLEELVVDPGYKNAEIASLQKEYVDNLFAVSGVADCATIDNIYNTVLKENQYNQDMILKIMKIYQRIGCTKSDVYYRACKIADKMNLSY